MALQKEDELFSNLRSNGTLTDFAEALNQHANNLSFYVEHFTKMRETVVNDMITVVRKKGTRDDRVMMVNEVVAYYELAFMLVRGVTSHFPVIADSSVKHYRTIPDNFTYSEKGDLHILESVDGLKDEVARVERRVKANRDRVKKARKAGKPTPSNPGDLEVPVAIQTMDTVLDNLASTLDEERNLLRAAYDKLGDNIDIMPVSLLPDKIPKQIVCMGEVLRFEYRRRASVTEVG